MRDGSISTGLADTVLMVRPADFGANPETAATNSFQTEAEERLHADIALRARRESDDLALSLQARGVEVCRLEDTSPPIKPDACFPNNWVSFHSDGTVVVYPMMAPNRRIERRLETVTEFLAAQGFRVSRIVDLTRWETSGAFLEGTGSLVLDHASGIAFCALSPRTCEGPIAEFAEKLGFDPILFNALDPRGGAVYHTNVVMSLAPTLAVVCLDAVPDIRQRSTIEERIRGSGREILTISIKQMAAFAGNVLMLRSRAGNAVLAMSATARRSFRQEQILNLERHAEILVAEVATIERYGGGSVRCMLAEVLLPRV